ncbi:MAG: HAD family hydrolase [Candidatus Aenigmatarchaeota archaeon]
MNYKAILIDMDGTLLPLNGIIKGIRLTCKKMKIRVLTKEEILHKMMGYKTEEVFSKLYPEYHRDGKSFRENYIKIYNRLKLAKIFPGVNKILMKIHKNGYKIGIVTTKNKLTALPPIRKYKLIYDVLITENDVKNRKPDPEPILKACKKLKVKPEECIFVGDHIFDMQAAKKAGCYPIGILTGVGTRYRLKKAGAKKVIKDLKSLVNLLDLR